MQPLVYAAVAFACGIGVAGWGWRWARLTLEMPWAAAGLLGLAAVLALGAAGRRRRGVIAGLGLACCFAAGYARTLAAIMHPPPPSALAQAAAGLEPGPRDRVFITGYARDTPQVLYEAGQSSTVRLDIEAVSLGRGAGARTRAVTGGVRLYAYPPAASRGEDWTSALLQIRAGEGVAVSAHLRPLRDYRDPGVADFTVTARRQGIVLTGTLALDAWRPWPGVSGPRSAAIRAAAWGWLSRRIDLLAPPARAARGSTVRGTEINALLRGMLLGDVARLDEATRTAFQIDGVYHLLVVAGLHIGVLAGMLYFLFRWARLPRLAAAGAVLALLGAYAWVIAGREPTLRALLMLSVYFGALFWYRERQALNAVGFAALVLMAWRPLELFRPGLQMSLGAATLLAGVAAPLLARTSMPLHRACQRLDDIGADLTFSPRVAQLRLDLRSVGRGRVAAGGVRAALMLYDVVVISLVLQLGFAGFNAVYFHRANPWTVVANACLVPAASVLIPLGWAGVVGGAVASRVAAPVVGGLCRAMLAAAAAMAHWPGAGWRVPSPPLWFLILFGAAVAAWILACGMGRRRRMAVATGALLALAAVVMAVAPFAPRLPRGLSATILDVGQGDSIFVAFPDGRTLLVDGGPRSVRWDTGAEVVEPFLWSLGLHRLDAVLLTHAHNDHLGGLEAVVGDFRPGEVWVTASLPTDAPTEAFLREVRQAGARLRRTNAGDAYLAGAARLQVLLPAPDYRAGPAPSNDDSMVVRVSQGDASLLLEGDAEAAGEHWMVDHEPDLTSTVLKVGHHGSKTSSTPAFLAAVHPSVAVISDGEGNEYGFPSPAVLANLERAGARVFRTDLDGAVQCRLRQGELQVYLFRRWPAG